MSSTSPGRKSSLRSGRLKRIRPDRQWVSCSFSCWCTATTAPFLNSRYAAMSRSPHTMRRVNCGLDGSASSSSKRLCTTDFMMIPSLGRHRLARRLAASTTKPLPGAWVEKPGLAAVAPPPRRTPSVSLVGEDYPAQAGLADAAKAPAREGRGSAQPKGEELTGRRMIEIDSGLREVVCLGVVRADGVAVARAAPGGWAEIERLAASLRTRDTGKDPGASAELQPARELYRRTGEDPTKLRPSSEALLRRVLRGEALYRINSLVDTCNLCSLEFLLPIGLYDADRIEGPVTVRLGIEGQGYDSLGKGFYSVADRLRLFDARGPFGSPTNDSRRTAIDETTQRCLMVIFGPGSYSVARLRAHVQTADARLRPFAQTTRVETAVLGGR